MTYYYFLQRLISQIRRFNQTKSSSLIFQGSKSHDFMKMIEMLSALTTLCVYEEISEIDFVMKIFSVKSSLLYFIKHLEKFHNKRTNRMLDLLSRISEMDFMLSDLIDPENAFEVETRSRAFFQATRSYLVTEISWESSRWQRPLQSSGFLFTNY